MWIFDTYSINNLEYMEFSLLPINVAEDEKESIRKLLTKKFIVTDSKEGFTENVFSEYNKYIIESIYYNYKLIDLISNNEEYNETLHSIMDNVDQAADIENLTAIDLVTCVCINSSLEIDNSLQLIERFLEEYFDPETSLLYERSIEDEIDSKVSFTVEVVKLLKDNYVDVDISRLEEGVRNYYETAEFKLPKEGDTLFNSGGLALYSMEELNLDFEKSQYNEWFNQWKDMFQPFTVNSWDDVLNLVCIYIPIADIFGESDDAKKNVQQFETAAGNVSEFINESFNEHMTYSLMSDYMLEFDDETKDLISQQCVQNLLDYVEILENITIEACFYGTQLAEAVQFSYDWDNMFEMCCNLYLSELSDYLNEDDTEIDIENFINDTYYFLLICDQNEAYGTNESRINKDDISKALKKCINEIQGSDIKDPNVMRILCECLSNTTDNVSKSFKKYMENYLKSCLEDKNMLYSRYITDFYVIDKIFNLDLIDKDMIYSILVDLQIDDCYTDYYKDDDQISIRATFDIYVLQSRFEELQFGNTVVSRMNEQVLTLLNESGWFQYYIGESSFDLKSNFYGYCLLYYYQ